MVCALDPGIERSGFEPCTGHVALGQNTLLLHCLFSPRCIKCVPANVMREGAGSN